MPSLVFLLLGRLGCRVPWMAPNVELTPGRESETHSDVRGNEPPLYTIWDSLQDITVGLSLGTTYRLRVNSGLSETIPHQLANHKGKNVEVYLEEIVVKSKTEKSLVQDVEETFRKLRRMNIRIDPNESTLGVEEGKFLSLPEDQEKVEQAANTDHSKGGRGTTTLPMPRKRNYKLRAICRKERNPKTRSLRTTFRKHKVRVATDGLIEEMLKLSEKEGQLAKWEAKLRKYDISFIREKEVERLIRKRFCRQGEQVLVVPNANEEETSELGAKLQAELTPTPRA
ncbi:hypothetical protein Tco_0645861 [Tanacetum coccineum]